MSGVLDSKARIIDAFITQEGRRQIASGDLRIEYISFTDAGTYYAADITSGSADATTRLYLEACNLPQDSITFEADDSGMLVSFNNSNDLEVKDGQILTYSFEAASGSLITGSVQNVNVLKGDEFASQASVLLASSLDNFNKLQVIATHDRLFEDDGFGIGPSNVEFVITNDRPINNPNLYTAHIDHVESLFNDVRLSHVKNFQFLPPINKQNDESIDKKDHRETSRYHLGHYRPWGRTHLDKLSYEQIKHELSYYEELGYVKTIKIDPTSRDNKMSVQFFEKSYNRLKKLDVIDFGKHRTGNVSSPTSHIFFVGKVMTDNNDTHTFIHMFTMIFE